jgi:lipopolysaccharide transport system ATP-binding protein
MSNTVISIENVSKSYQLGVIGTGTFKEDLNRWWARRRGKPDPYQKIGGEDFGNRQGETLWALKNINTQIQQGEALGIIGRNGAGKSTLLKVLSEVTAPTGGEVKIRGRIASLLEVGTGFHPDLTGRENVYLNGAIMGMKRIEISRKFDEIVDFSGVEQFIDTPVKRYSSGMYVRLGFAVAAHLEPEILIVDEVLAVGDAEFQKKCLGKMENAAEGGRTVIFVSHNMPSIQALCQRVILLQGGTTIMDGEASSVISHYLSNFSNGLDGNPAEVDLRNHPGRSRSKEPALKRTWITNGAGDINNSIEMGGSLTLYYQFECSRKISSPDFILVVEDERGVPIFNLKSALVATENNTFKSIRAGTVCFHIPHIPLMPGTYHASITLTEDNDFNRIDSVQRAISIEVLPKDVYGTGKIPSRTAGNVFVQGEINVEPL